MYISSYYYVRSDNCFKYIKLHVIMPFLIFVMTPQVLDCITSPIVGWSVYLHLFTKGCMICVYTEEYDWLPGCASVLRTSLNHVTEAFGILVRLCLQSTKYSPNRTVYPKFHSQLSSKDHTKQPLTSHPSSLHRLPLLLGNAGNCPLGKLEMLVGLLGGEGE